jgi:hypothetical protein
MNPIAVIFSQIFAIGMMVQNSSSSIDGKALWGKLEQIVLTIPVPGVQDDYTSAGLLEFHTEIKRLDAQFDLTKNEFTQISNHFLLQLSNLPFVKSKEKIVLFRLMQIAFNAGQLHALDRSGKLNPEISKTLAKFDYISMSFYINEAQAERLASKIT